MRDKGVQATVVLVAAALAGFVAVGLSWSGVAARLAPGLQLPFLVSGGFGGVALAAAFVALIGVHLERRHSATERHHLDRVVRDMARVADGLEAALGRPASALAGSDRGADRPTA